MADLDLCWQSTLCLWKGNHISFCNTKSWGHSDMMFLIQVTIKSYLYSRPGGLVLYVATGSLKLNTSRFWLTTSRKSVSFLWFIIVRHTSLSAKLAEDYNGIFVGDKSDCWKRNHHPDQVEWPGTVPRVPVVFMCIPDPRPKSCIEHAESSTIAAKLNEQTLMTSNICSINEWEDVNFEYYMQPIWIGTRSQLLWKFGINVKCFRLSSTT